MAEDIMKDFPPIDSLTSERRSAGADYLDHLRRLGLFPYTALWAFDEDAAEFRLLIFTDLIALKGPTAVYELLHKAYNEAKTPTEIDPWIVELIDINHPFRDRLRQALVAHFGPTSMRALNEAGDEIDVPFEHDGSYGMTSFDHFVFSEEWTYFQDRTPKHLSPSQQWKRLEQNVGPLAA